MSETDKLQESEEMSAAMFRARSQASSLAEASQTDPKAGEDASASRGPANLGPNDNPAAEAERESEATTTNQLLSPLSRLDLDSSIRLRWTLRDIKSKRTKFTPAASGDLQTLTEMGLVEMREDIPALTDAGYREID